MSLTRKSLINTIVMETICLKLSFDRFSKTILKRRSNLKRLSQCLICRLILFDFMDQSKTWVKILFFTRLCAQNVILSICNPKTSNLTFSNSYVEILKNRHEAFSWLVYLIEDSHYGCPAFLLPQNWFTMIRLWNA